MEYNPRKLAELLSDPTLKLTGVSRIADVSSAYLTELKKGRREPSAKMLGRLASALGKPIDYFFDEKVQHIELKDTSNG